MVLCILAFASSCISTKLDSVFVVVHSYFTFLSFFLLLIYIYVIQHHIRVILEHHIVY